MCSTEESQSLGFENNFDFEINFLSSANNPLIFGESVRQG